MLFHLQSLEALLHHDNAERQQESSACDSATSPLSCKSHTNTKPLHQIDEDGMMTMMMDDDDDDDECSVATASTCSSTTSASSCSSSESSTSTSSSSRTNNKSVRFNTDDNVVHRNDRWCKEDAYDACWLHPADYRRLKTHTTALAREVARAEERNRAPYSYQRVILRTYEVCRTSVAASEEEEQHDDDDGGNVLTSEERKHLNRWCEYAVTRLGLEKWAVRHISKERSVRRAELVQAVLGLQAAATCNNADRDDTIRLCSERMSRPSRLFARSMAQANAAVMEKQPAVFSGMSVVGVACC